MHRRLTSILLLVTFLGLGTGGFSYLHERQHAAEDAAEAVADGAADRHGGRPAEHHHHDETNCPRCAQLHLPMVAVAAPPPVVSVGPLVSTLSLVRRSLVCRPPPAQADCRDPPVVLPA